MPLPDKRTNPSRHLSLDSNFSHAFFIIFIYFDIDFNPFYAILDIKLIGGISLLSARVIPPIYRISRNFTLSWRNCDKNKKCVRLCSKLADVDKFWFYFLFCAAVMCHLQSLSITRNCFLTIYVLLVRSFHFEYQI